MPTYCGINGAVRKLKEWPVGIGGVVKQQKEVWAAEGGVKKKIFSAIKTYVVTTKKNASGSNYDDARVVINGTKYTSENAGVTFSVQEGTVASCYARNGITIDGVNQGGGFAIDYVINSNTEFTFRHSESYIPGVGVVPYGYLDIVTK